jgi:hypothetical protein
MRFTGSGFRLEHSGSCCYSGKKKDHTVKNVLLVNALLTILFLSATSGGRIHDGLIQTMTLVANCLKCPRHLDMTWPSRRKDVGFVNSPPVSTIVL